MKKKKIRNIILGIIDVVVILLAVYFVIGYVNFYKIKNNEKPIFVVQEKKYSNGSGNVHVYDNIVYKIVKYEIPEESLSIGLRLWVMKDVD